MQFTLGLGLGLGLGFGFGFGLGIGLGLGLGLGLGNVGMQFAGYVDIKGDRFSYIQFRRKNLS